MTTPIRVMGMHNGIFKSREKNMKFGKLLLAALSLSIGLAALAPLGAQADEHHRHKVCHSDKHHHRTCHWVN